MAKRLTLIALAAGALLVQVYGQRRVATPAPPQKLNLDAESLPSNFTGDNIVAVYRQMYSQMAPKGEYETSEQYRSRISRAIDRYKDQVLTFRFKPALMPGVNDDYAFYSTVYDADSQEMKVDIPSKGTSGELEVNIGGSVNQSKYKASNRFGVSTTVTRYVGNLYDIVFDWKPGRIRAKFKIPPSQAKVVSNRLSILFIGKPKVKNGSGSMVKSYEPMSLGPSMDYPYEDLTRSHTIYMDIISIWVYDRVTMKVLAKVAQ